jgi:hypothetical protein
VPPLRTAFVYPWLRRPRKKKKKHPSVAAKRECSHKKTGGGKKSLAQISCKAPSLSFLLWISRLFFWRLVLPLILPALLLLLFCVVLLSLPEPAACTTKEEQIRRIVDDTFCIYMCIFILVARSLFIFSFPYLSFPAFLCIASSFVLRMRGMPEDKTGGNTRWVEMQHDHYHHQGSLPLRVTTITSLFHSRCSGGGAISGNHK